MACEVPRLWEMFRHAWICRTNMEMETCRQLFEELRVGLKLPAAIPYEKLLFEATAQPELLVEWILLAASLIRAEGNLTESRRLIEKVEAFLHERALAPPYSLLFQKGLTHFNEGDASDALDRFLAARQVARFPSEEIFALGNILLCLENLGLPLEPFLGEWDRALALIPKKDSSYEEAHRTRLALVCRQAFRAGEPGLAFEFVETDPVSQTFYYRLWLSELPFHAFYRRAGDSQRQAFYVANPLSHQKAYRTRTLLGLVHPMDLKQFKVTELADRLYLWTWRWLQDCESFPIARILAILRAVDWEAIGPKLAAEDFVMVRNALAWLSLFDRSSEGAIEKLIRKLRPVQPPQFPLFEWEFELIRYWRMRRNAAPQAEALAHDLLGNELARRPHLHLPALIELARDPGQLADLRRQLAAMADEAQPSPAALYIDLARHQVIGFDSANPVISTAICAALELLRSKGCVELEEMALVCFGIRRFDELVHGPRISNLLTRIRRLVPEGLRLQIRNGRVHAIGHWNGIRFLRPHRLSESLCGEADWKQWVREAPALTTSPKNTRWVAPSALLKQLQPNVPLRREDLERLTGKSRSSMNRMIASWLKRGILKKSGKARKTRYYVQEAQRG